MPRSHHQVTRPQTGDRALARLADLGFERAGRLGHALVSWEAPPHEEGTALRSYCTRCRRTVYVRAEDGLEGLAGNALRERCSRAGEPKQLGTT